MSIHLGLRITLGGLVGGLLVISVAAALQFRDMAMAIARVGREPELAEQLVTQANAAALGLGITGVLVLLVGVGVSRVIRASLIDRVVAMDQAAGEILQGDAARRVAIGGSDELARIARALDFVLDQRDRSDAEMRGHNREVRALLVALLRQWPKPAAVTGIDGEIIVSTLTSDAEEVLRSLTPRVRAAAKILLSRGFASASELSTVVNTGTGHVAQVQALALGEQRIVGWLAVFSEASKAVESDPLEQPASSEPEPQESDAPPEPDA
ncbi:hypothetical protein ACNOYE_30645 [Nannocystaceae bacterium ST9]